MNKHLFLYLMALIGMMVVTTAATAQDRLWMAKEAGRTHAAQHISVGKAFHSSAGDRLAGERLWIARLNALGQLEKSGVGSDLAGSQRIKSTEPLPDNAQNPLVCKQNVPGLRLFFKGYGRVAADSEKCG